MTDVLAKNDAIAARLQERFKENGVFVMNLLGSPGAGKTSLLENTLVELSKRYKVAVIEGDLYTDKDAHRIHRLGIPVIQINTVGGCHLDAQMVERVIDDLNLEDLDVVVIENVGNLVCPAEFLVGEELKATVLSITEGEDKPLKYPLIFKESKAVILNKIDLLPYVPFDKEAAIGDIKKLNPSVALFEVSCTSKSGIDEWIKWISEHIERQRSQ